MRTCWRHFPGRTRVRSRERRQCHVPSFRRGSGTFTRTSRSVTGMSANPYLVTAMVTRLNQTRSSGFLVGPRIALSCPQLQIPENRAALTDFPCRHAILREHQQCEISNIGPSSGDRPHGGRQRLPFCVGHLLPLASASALVRVYPNTTQAALPTASRMGVVTPRAQRYPVARAASSWTVHKQSVNTLPHRRIIHNSFLEDSDIIRIRKSRNENRFRIVHHYRTDAKVWQYFKLFYFAEPIKKIMAALTRPLLHGAIRNAA